MTVLVCVRVFRLDGISLRLCTAPRERGNRGVTPQERCDEKKVAELATIQAALAFNQPEFLRIRLRAV